LVERENPRQGSEQSVKHPMRVSRGHEEIPREPPRIRKRLRLGKVVWFVDAGAGRSPCRECGEHDEYGCREDVLATRHFFFFLAFPAGFDLELFAGFFATSFPAAAFLAPPAPLPNAFSQ